MIENIFKEPEAHADTASSEFVPTRSQTVQQNDFIGKGRGQLIENLQQQVAQVKSTLHRNHMSLEKLNKSQEMQQYIEETKQEITILKNKNKEEQALLKQEFGKGLAALQHKLRWWQREKQECKIKEEELIRQSMEELKNSKENSQKGLSLFIKETTQQIKQKNNNLFAQFKDFKKQQEEGKSRLMSQLEQIRGYFEQQCEEQRLRRIEYQQIVMNLLDRTCEQGERLLRRIL